MKEKGGIITTLPRLRKEGKGGKKPARPLSARPRKTEGKKGRGERGPLSSRDQRRPPGWRFIGRGRGEGEEGKKKKKGGKAGGEREGVRNIPSVSLSGKYWEGGREEKDLKIKEKRCVSDPVLHTITASPHVRERDAKEKGKTSDLRVHAPAAAKKRRE